MFVFKMGQLPKLIFLLNTQVPAIILNTLDLLSHLILAMMQLIFQFYA